MPDGRLHVAPASVIIEAKLRHMLERREDL